MKVRELKEKAILEHDCTQIRYLYNGEEVKSTNPFEKLDKRTIARILECEIISESNDLLSGRLVLCVRG